MKRTPITLQPHELPEAFRALAAGADAYDSSCSAAARVICIERDGGYFLKSAEKGSLEQEAQLARYFHRKGLTAPVEAYLSLDKDWLLTRRVPGEDATAACWRAEPARLAEKAGEILRMIHETAAADCPVADRMTDYCALAEENHRRGLCDLSRSGFASPEEAYRVFREGRALLKNDTLIHGDYCLPNFLLDGWRFTGLIDLGAAGLGDRHVDLYWGAWSLGFNLKTDRFRDRFLDAYGRDRVDPDALLAVTAAEAFG